MQKIKVSDLTPDQLNEWVAKGLVKGTDWEGNDAHFNAFTKDFDPCHNWSQGGPLIEEFDISVHSDAYILCDIYELPPKKWFVSIGRGENVHQAVDDNLLIAAMRAIVASKFGEYVEIEQ